MADRGLVANTHAAAGNLLGQLGMEPANADLGAAPPLVDRIPRAARFVDEINGQGYPR